MKNVIEQIKTRRSVRTYDGQLLNEETKDKLETFMKDVENPFDIPVGFRFLDAKEHGLTCPVGYTAKKMSVRETMMRMAIKADDRLLFEELFYDGTFDTPLSKEKADSLRLPLEMVRLAPSAVNKQPWRIVIKDDCVHFYLKRSKGFGHEGKLDM